MNGAIRLLLRAVAAIIFAQLPDRVRSYLFRRVLGWDVHPSASIGLSILDVDRVELGAGARIGHLNVIRGMRKVVLGDHALIGHWNWISASRPLIVVGGADGGVLIVGRHTAITLRHYLDASGGIIVGEFTTVAGIRSTFLSHQIDVYRSEGATAMVEVGDYCFIGSDTRVTPGARIPDRCVIAMGAVVAGRLEEEDTLYGGVPARPIKKVEGAKYFDRDWGHLGGP